LRGGTDKEVIVMLRIGLFGCGRIGKVHAAAVAAHPRAELAWVSDPVLDSAATLGDRYGARATVHAQEVLDDPTVDAVIIGSPTPTHVDLIAAAVRAKKAVMCEKPIDLDIARVDACWKEIAELSPTVMVAFMRRFDRSIRALRDGVHAGQIGQLEQLLITSRDVAAPPRSYIAVSGGIFRDMTIHDFDIARFIMGDVVEVQAMGANLIDPDIQAEGDVDSVMVTVRSADGALCQIVNSRRCVVGYDQRIEAFGSAGVLNVGNHVPSTVSRGGPGFSTSSDGYVEAWQERFANAYHAELDHFVTSVLAGSAVSPTFDDGRAALLIADAATQSLISGGQPIRVVQDA
jgi:myo-inositol 2-dehydrogenase/D-chiro-inositol 1-dehydrogenase